MKTYANNPPVKYSQLNKDQRANAFEKLGKDKSISDSFLIRITSGCFVADKIVFHITSPTSVAVKKK